VTLVVDASALVELTGPRAEAIAAMLGRRHLDAPEIITLEIAQILRREVRLERRTGTEAGAAMRWILDHPGITTHQHRALGWRVWSLRDNFTAYDASYVALAELLDSPLVTIDRHLARVATRYVDVIVPE